MRYIAHAHGHSVLACQFQREADVLVRKAQREAGRIEVACEECVRVSVGERASSPYRAIGDRLEERFRVHARLDAERQALGNDCLQAVTDAVVHQLCDAARSYRSDVAHLVADGVQRGLYSLVHFAVAADHDRKPARACPHWATANRRIQHAHAFRREIFSDAAYERG